MTTKVCVTATALRQVLEAMTGPPHLARELQVIRNLYQKTGGDKDPLTILIEEYQEWNFDKSHGA